MSPGLTFNLCLNIAGPDKGGYYHEMFLRGKQFLSELIPRVHIKAEKARTKMLDYPWYPDFETMPHLLASSPECVFRSDCRFPWKAAPSAVDTAVSLLQQQQEQQRRLLEELVSLTHRQSNAMDDHGTLSLLNLLHEGHTGYQTPLQRALNQAIEFRSLLSSLHF